MGNIRMQPTIILIILDIMIQSFRDFYLLSAPTNKKASKANSSEAFNFSYCKNSFFALVFFYEIFISLFL